MNDLSNTNANLPNVSDVIVDWFLNITFQYITHTQSGARYTEQTTQTINTQGVVQPPSNEDLKIYPEGTWSWRWLTIHTLPTVQLDTNNYIVYDNVKYKIMSKKDWSKYGYIKYTILEAFQADKL